MTESAYERAGICAKLGSTWTVTFWRKPAGAGGAGDDGVGGHAADRGGETRTDANGRRSAMATASATGRPRRGHSVADSEAAAGQLLSEPARAAAAGQQALLAVVQQEAYIEGVGTRVNIGMKCPRIIALKCPLISIGNVRSELRHRRRSSRACGYVGNSEPGRGLSIYPQARRAGPQRAATSSTSSSVGFGRPSSPARRFSLSRAAFPLDVQVVE